MFTGYRLTSFVAGLWGWPSYDGLDVFNPFTAEGRVHALCREILAVFSLGFSNLVNIEMEYCTGGL